MSAVAAAVARRAAWLRQGAALRRIRTLEGLEEHVERTRPAEFLHYRALAGEKREAMAALLAALELDVAGRRALDLGPGHGDALDLLGERGARCSFVERDPLFAAYNSLKGHDGRRFDYVRRLSRLAGEYDLVHVGNSISYPSFRRGGAAAARRWLARLRGHGAPGSTIVVSPWWPVEPEGTGRELVLGHWLSDCLLAEGYELLPPVAGYDHPAISPVTFAYRAP